MLLDINMPVMDGLTLLSELRARQSPVRAIIVSAYGDMANIRTAMNRGAFDFVTKPVDLNDLEITMRKTLDEIARIREIDRRRAAAERARTNLSRYFSPNLVEMLAERDEPLGAVRRQTVAVLFVDIVGFTRMAEMMPPEAVVTMLREFHDRMTAQIFACGGTVEKYIGDAIFAVFGLPSETRRTRSTRCAAPRGCSPRSTDWNAERARDGRAAARHRHRAQLRPGRDRRCRQRTQPVLHRHRRYGQYRGPPAGPDPGAQHAARRRRRAGRGGPGAAARQRRGPARPLARWRRADAARPRRSGPASGPANRPRPEPAPGAMLLALPRREDGMSRRSLPRRHPIKAICGRPRRGHLIFSDRPMDRPCRRLVCSDMPQPLPAGAGTAMRRMIRPAMPVARLPIRTGFSRGRACRDAGSGASPAGIFERCRIPSPHSDTAETSSSAGSLTLAALGVVFGDIGTSPLYAAKQSLLAFGGVSEHAIFGALSLIFWSLILVVTVKYVVVIMRADNRGEGGLLSLTALVLRTTHRGQRRYLWIMGRGWSAPRCSTATA